jgi:hypothetical protein
MEKDNASIYSFMGISIVIIVILVFLILFGISTIGVSIAFCFLGVYLFLTSYLKFQKIKEFQCWSKSNIEILNSEIIEKEIPDKFLNLIYYYPYIEYQYTVNGQKFHSNIYAFDIESYLCQEINECDDLIKQINEVYYNPKNYNEAYIKTSISTKRKQHFIALELGGIILIFLGIGILFI